jgi:hypothetical protein
VIYPAPKHRIPISRIRSKFQLFKNTNTKGLEVVHAEIVPTRQGFGGDSLKTHQARLERSYWENNVLFNMKDLGGRTPEKTFV